MAGISAITSIAIACGNIGVTDLLIENSDYFSFHVIRRMRNSDPDESVLNVLAVMIKYSNLDIVPSIAHIIREVKKKNKLFIFLKFFCNLGNLTTTWTIPRPQHKCLSSCDSNFYKKSSKVSQH